MATAFEIAERHQRILETVETWGGKGPRTKELLDELERQFGISQRNIQRDLKQLTDIAQLEKREDHWRIADVVEYERMSNEYAACLITKLAATTLDYALPNVVKTQIRAFITKSERRLETAFRNHPARRWHDALRIVPATSHLNVQKINPDVRIAVEQAIIERRKVILHYQPKQSVKVSISHLILRLPNSATLVTWNPDHPCSVVFELVDLDSVEVLEESASWPMDFNIDHFVTSLGKRNPLSPLTFAIKLLVHPGLLEHWQKRFVAGSMTIGDVDASSGRVHVTLSEEPNDAFKEWLWEYAPYLEVIEPDYLREYMLTKTRLASEPYANDTDPPHEEMTWEELEKLCKEDIRLLDLEIEQSRGDGPEEKPHPALIHYWRKWMT
jgi:hypothetical protein